MGLYLFSRHSREDPVPPNPDPFKFEIIRFYRIGGYLCLKVYYPGVTSFEGNKIIVLKTDKTIDDIEVLDPHFDEGGEVVARFAPTDEGWSDAIDFCESRKKKDWHKWLNIKKN
jgi:hypothetical protein